MKLLTLLILAVGISKLAGAQSTDSAKLVAVNQAIDSYVVAKNITALAPLYASDFIFSHGSGRVEGTEGWMQTVKRAEYLQRQHDSVTVEMHGDIAVVKGKMNIQKQNKEKVDRYWLKYIRVYRKKGGWQLLSHTTIAEQHE